MAKKKVWRSLEEIFLKKFVFLWKYYYFCISIYAKTKGIVKHKEPEEIRIIAKCFLLLN